MKQILQTLQFSAQILNFPPSLNSQTQIIPNHHLPPSSTIPPSLKSNHTVSRRELAIRIGSSSSLLLLSGTYLLTSFKLPEARAEDDLMSNDNADQQELNSDTNSCTNRTVTKRAFIDVSINGEPVGRVIIGLYGVNVPIGTARFSDLVSGAAGISYRRKEFVKILPNYVQHGGVRSYGVDVELAKKTGSDLAVDKLIQEWEKMNEKCSGTKNSAGTVSIVVRDPSKPPPKLKLMARGGKLVIDEEEVGTDPNGTEFVITTKDSPELDASSLVVGRVLGGMEVVDKIAKVKTVQENTSSPYFRVAKLIGDKRAVVAERGFNRPYSKVVITNCGLID